MKPYQIPSGSMKNTLDEGQRVLVNRASTKLGGDPEIGDIYVFHPPTGAQNGRQCGVEHSSDQACPEPTAGASDDNFIKRVVAGPGDRLRIEDGHVFLNGEMADEPFARDCAKSGGGGCDLPEEITIPPDHYFMMGDNRGGSDDSRFWGPVPREQFIGQAFATYWPPSRIGVF